MEELEKIKQLILTMVKAIVSQPDKVEINISDEVNEKGEHTQINIKVSQPDIKVAIGRGGVTAEAIRRIAVLYAIRLGYRKYLLLRVDAPILAKNHYYSEVSR